MERFGIGPMKVGFALLVVIGLMAGAGTAHAQSTSLQTLSQDLQRLRNDVTDLQRYVYAGQGQPSSVVPSTDSSGTTGSADLQLRVQQLEEKIRQLTGSVEELQHRQSQISDRLDKLISDLDARFSALQGGAAAGATASGGTAATDTTGTADTTGQAADTGAASGNTGASQGNLTQDDLTAGQSGDAGAAGSVLPAGSEMDQYNYAFSLLRKADYDGAETAFNEFITMHPDSQLSGNAYYWLGETYYVRNSYQQAAIAFLKGYQKFPDGDKAPDNLLKLGMTLTRLSKNAEACATFNELKSKFPDAPRPCATRRRRRRPRRAAARVGSIRDGILPPDRLDPPLGRGNRQVNPPPF